VPAFHANVGIRIAPGNPPEVPGEKEGFSTPQNHPHKRMILLRQQ
jgi:hypothetical protein